MSGRVQIRKYSLNCILKASVLLNDQFIWSSYNLLNILSTPFHKKACKFLLELDLALKDSTSNIALKAFSQWHLQFVQKLPSIEIVKSYGLNSHLVSLKYNMSRDT